MELRKPMRDKGEQPPRRTPARNPRLPKSFDPTAVDGAVVQANRHASVRGRRYSKRRVSSIPSGDAAKEQAQSVGSSEVLKWKAAGIRRGDAGKEEEAESVVSGEAASSVGTCGTESAAFARHSAVMTSSSRPRRL